MVLDSIKQGIGPLSGIGGMYPAYYWLITTFSCLGARPKVLPTTIIITINPLPAPSRSPDADCYQSSSPSRSPQLPMKNLKFSTGAISLKLHVTIVWRKIWMLLEGLLTDWPTGVNTRRCCHISIILKISDIGSCESILDQRTPWWWDPTDVIFDTTQLKSIGKWWGGVGGWSINSTDRQTRAGKQTRQAQTVSSPVTTLWGMTSPKYVGQKWTHMETNGQNGHSNLWQSNVWHSRLGHSNLWQCDIPSNRQWVK